MYRRGSDAGASASGSRRRSAPHDLRRTCATRLNALAVLPHVAEKILNHTMQGVMAVYNRADCKTERVEAMQRWADELDRILGES